MTERKVVHEIKFQRSTTVILAALVFGVILNAIGPELSIKSAMAELYGGQFGAIQVSISHSGTIRN